MARIAVIAAGNVGFHNPGMLTVDLAFDAMRKRLGHGVNVSWYSILHPAVLPTRGYVDERELPFQLKSISNNLHEVYEHDSVVFWGDFLHARHYIEQDATMGLVKFGVAADRDGARQLLYRSLFLRDAPDEVLSRTVLYGGTVLHNSQADYVDKDYNSAFTRLITKSRAVWMREPLSAAKIAHLRPNDVRSHFGTDAALLLRPGDLDILPTTGWAATISKGDVAGVFVGQRTEIPGWMRSFCEELADRLDVRLEWLPWLPAEPSPALGIEARTGRTTVGDLLAAVAGYKFVITDTYHLSLNAWRSGTPAVCIGSPQPAETPTGVLTLNDLKKHIFHLSYDAGDFYIPTERGKGDQWKVRLERVAQLLDRGYESVVDRIRLHAERSGDSLKIALESILGSALR